MNIGIFTDSFTPQVNGVVTSLKLFIGEFERGGHKVFVFAPNDHFGFSHAPEPNVRRFPSISMFGDQVKLAVPLFSLREIAGLHLDVIHTQTPGPIGMAGVRAGRKLKIPLVHTYHTFLEKYIHYVPVPRRIAEKILSWALGIFFNKHAALIAPSEGIKRNLQKYTEKPIRVIPTGIDLEKNRKLSRAKDPWEILKKYALEKRTPLLITANRLGKEKNISFLIEVFSRIKKKHADCALLIAGDGPERAALVKEAESLGVQNDIVFLGFLPHDKLFSLYMASKIFLFSSTTETQGLVTLEAMAVGLPVVALEATGTEDLMAGNRGGFMVHDSLEDFSNKVDVLLTNKEIWREKSKEATERSELFSIHSMAEKILLLYQSIHNNQPKLL